MIRAFAVAALIGCACGSAPPAAAPVRTSCPACPACPEVPAVDLALCPLDDSVSRAATELGVLGRGRGFWCTSFMDGKYAGRTHCLRYRDYCEDRRRTFRDRYKMSECRPTNQASCVEITDRKRQNIYFRCFPTDQCRALRDRTIAEFPDLEIGACRETE